ncbi:MAG: hypothetical protein PGN07_10775 [Aeromicrobium erythreum]
MDDREQERRSGFARYPAPGRPEQPMPQAPSPWPWIIGGTVVAVLTLLGPIVIYAVISGHPG